MTSGGERGPRQKAFAEVPSQVTLDGGPRLLGRIALWRDRNPDGRAEASYVAGARVAEPHVRDGYLPWAAAPAVAWTGGGDGGPLSPMSFVALWNEGAPRVEGLAIRLDLADPAAAALPWVAWHPSGCLQAVRFDEASRLFVRRLLYAFCDPLVEAAALGRR